MEDCNMRAIEQSSYRASVQMALRRLANLYTNQFYTSSKQQHIQQRNKTEAQINVNNNSQVNRRSFDSNHSSSHVIAATAAAATTFVATTKEELVIAVAVSQQQCNCRIFVWPYNNKDTIAVQQSVLWQLLPLHKVETYWIAPQHSVVEEGGRYASEEMQ